MLLGITINNILRDHITHVEEAYKSLFDTDPIKPINPYNLRASFPSKETNVVNTEFSPDIDNPELVHHENDDEFDVYKFIYEEAAFEVFGKGNLIKPNLLFDFKRLERNNHFEIVLLNKESSRSKCATLFFLSKNNFDFKKLFFPTTNKEFWKYVDVLITDDPEILKVKPKNKMSIKIENQFNKDIDADITISGIGEIRKAIKELKLKQIILRRKWKKSKKH